MIRVDALWLSVAPLDMRAGMDTLLAQVVQVFGEARPHHAYLFANRRGTRMKVLIHDGQGIPPDVKAASSVCCAVGPGATIRLAAALPTASKVRSTSVTTSSAFGCVVAPPSICGTLRRWALNR